MLLQQSETEQRQCRHNQSGGDVTRSPEDADEDIGDRHDRRDECGNLPAGDRRHDEKRGNEECQQGEKYRAEAPADTLACCAKGDKSTEQPDRHDRGPNRLTMRRKDIIETVAGHPENSPQDKMRGAAFVPVQRRTACLRRFNVSQRIGSILWRQHYGRKSPHILLQITL